MLLKFFLNSSLENHEIIDNSWYNSIVITRKYRRIKSNYYISDLS